MKKRIMGMLAMTIMVMMVLGLVGTCPILAGGGPLPEVLYFDVDTMEYINGSPRNAFFCIMLTMSRATSITASSSLAYISVGIFSYRLTISYELAPSFMMGSNFCL